MLHVMHVLLGYKVGITDIKPFNDLLVIIARLNGRVLSK